ncbi:MAG: CapA family protein [Euzebya sp.]
MRGRADGIAKVALGMSIGLLGFGALVGDPMLASATDGQPAVALESTLEPAQSRPDVVSGGSSVGSSVGASVGVSGGVSDGVSVVRRRWPPDRYQRPPDQPYRAFTLAATGDLLIHTPVRSRAATADGSFDFAPQLAQAYDDVAAADLGLCHLEVPLDPDGPYSSYPIFNAPAELAVGIAATGWDVCSTASNHSADKGFEGLVATLDALDGAGVGHRGTFRTQEDSVDPVLHTVQGVEVGLLSATYGLNGLPAPGGFEWSVLRIDSGVIADRAADLRAAGAEVVVVSLHWGNEYQHAPSSYQRTIAAQLMSSGQIDAIIGHHAHVIQPVEWIEDRPVVFGLGNFLSGQRPTERRDGAIVTLEFEESYDGWHVEAVHAQPTWVDDAYRVVIADPDAGGVVGASAQRTLGYLGVPLSPPPGPPTYPPDHYSR